MEKRFTTVGSLSLLLALSGPPSCSTPASGPSGAHEDGDPAPPPSISIASINGAGSGCREPGSVSFTSAPEEGTVSINYAELSINSSPSVTFQHLNCATSIVFNGAAGWQIVASARTVRGVAHLPDGARAKVTTSLFLAGIPQEVSPRLPLSGPFEGPYSDATDLPLSDTIVSPCGEGTIFTVNTGLDLNASASAQPDSSVKVETVEVKFALRAC